MKFLDRIRAKKVAAEVGAEYNKSVAQWKNKLKGLMKALDSGIHEDVKVNVSDMMPEELFFFNVQGSILIDGQGASTVDATVVDNGYQYSAVYHPSFMLLKNNPRSKEDYSPNNTTLYKVSYDDNYFGKGNNKNPFFTVESMIKNTNETTKEFFPYIFQKATVYTEKGKLGTTEISHYPDVKFDNDENANFCSNSVHAIRLYADKIMRPIYAYSQNPRQPLDMSVPTKNN